MPTLFKKPFDLFYDDKTGYFVKTTFVNGEYLTKMRLFRDTRMILAGRADTLKEAYANHNLWCSIAKNVCDEINTPRVK